MSSSSVWLEKTLTLENSSLFPGGCSPDGSETSFFLFVNLRALRHLVAKKPFAPAKTISSLAGVPRQFRNFFFPLCEPSCPSGLSGKKTFCASKNNLFPGGCSPDGSETSFFLFVNLRALRDLVAKKPFAPAKTISKCVTRIRHFFISVQIQFAMPPSVNLNPREDLSANIFPEVIKNMKTWGEKLIICGCIL
jgi:hypothetical protein